MEKDLKKTFWSDAAMAGLVLGLVVVAMTVVCWLLKLDISMTWAPSIMNFSTIAVCIYVYGKRRAVKCGDEGYSYSASMSYVLAMMLFAGFITGVGGYIMNNFVAPEYYQQVVDTALLNSGMDVDSKEVDMAMGMVKKLTRSAWFTILSSVFNMVIYGTFVGLLASVFIKKEPKPFSEN